MATVSNAVLPSDVGWKKVAAGYVVVHMKAGTYYVLRDVSAAIWTLLLEGKTESEITGQLAAEYAVRADAVAADVHNFLGRLSSMKLINRVQPAD